MTSTELAIPAELPNPLTGELIPTADTPAIARTLADLRAYKRQVEAAITAFQEPLIAESRRLGTKTLNLGDVVAKVGPDHEVVWDHEILAELRAAGLPEERYDELVTAVVEYKVNGSVARQLAGANPEFAAILERAKGSQPRKVYVSVA